jgi:hypothetical protein
MVILLVLVGTITIGTQARIEPSRIADSGLTQPNLLGWQLLYIMPVAILTNDFFLSNFWLRTFASKTDRDLWLGVGAASACVLVVLVLVGVAGLVAVWAAPDPADVDGAVAFFVLLEQLPSWVVGIVLVMAVTLSTAAFDSLQSAMVSTASNDLFRNRLSIWFIRGAVVLVMVPVVVLALKAPSVLQVLLISDLVSAAVIPVLVIGLSDRLAWWWRGFDVVVGGLGGILSIWIFGTVYYGDARAGGELLLLQQGFFADDWGAFGAFVAAPVGGLIFGAIACASRLAVLWILAKKRGMRFAALDRPMHMRGVEYVDNAGVGDGSDRNRASTDGEHMETKQKGTFF